MKFNFIYFTLFILLFFQIDKSMAQPNCLWAQSGGGRSQKIAIDNNGNTYIIGYFGSNAITYGSFNLYLGSTALQDIFIVKFDPNGIVQWAKNTGAKYGEGTGIAVDSIGNVYVTGWYSAAPITFDTITLQNAGLPDVFVAKLDPSGNTIWAKRAGGNNNDFSRSISVDNAGNALITGNFTSNSITFGGITLQNSFVSYPDLFVVKYDNNGNVTWAKSFGGNTGFPAETGYSIATDDIGNSYVVGLSGADSISFDNGISYIVKNTFNYFFLVKFDPLGNTIMSKGFNSGGNPVPLEVKVDINNNVFICGYFSSSLTLDTISLSGFSMDDIFIAKLNSNGQTQWAKQAGGNNEDRALGLAISNNGNVFMTGYYKSSIAFFDTLSLNLQAGPDMFLAKYDYNGNAIFAIKGTTNFFTDDYGYSVAADNNHSIWTGFWSNNNLTFGTCYLTSNGGTFVVKFDANISGLNSIFNSIDVNIYPNPSNGDFIVDIPKQNRNKLILVISNALGESLKVINPLNSQDEINLNLTDGIYFLNVFDGEKSYCKKLIVEHD